MPSVQNTDITNNVTIFTPYGGRDSQPRPLIKGKHQRYG